MEEAKKVIVPDSEMDNVYIHGYKARDLLTLATMLENEEVTPTDLNDYVRNVEHSYTVLEQDFNERVSKIMNGYFEEEL